MKEEKIQTLKHKEAEEKRKKYFEEKKAQRQREKEAEERYYNWIKKKVRTPQFLLTSLVLFKIQRFTRLLSMLNITLKTETFLQLHFEMAMIR